MHFRSVSRFFYIISDPGGTRTLDPMIKSHLLYQLSYEVLSYFGIANVDVFLNIKALLFCFFYKNNNWYGAFY